MRTDADKGLSLIHSLGYDGVLKWAARPRTVPSGEIPYIC
ncbi:hypothetical protein NT01EI_2896 [Edwardsiella ictaluri 93-146]|uniref:Uncharacterized protein n=1 Tax=Edwardsiella ictaluri (strain 93-146) TaxID=634503 RepID=C5BG94_EDWI9|nr:hypothetical protein NT01EI_2896 [Edwardsiella ictaluri 93-146]